jgi:antimicrobial peptide system SdpB family protein
MQQLIARLKNANVYTPKIALARFLLALGMCLTLLCSDMRIVANHRYTEYRYFTGKDHPGAHAPLAQFDLFRLLPHDAARWVMILMLLVVMSGYLPQITCFLQVWVSFSVSNYLIVANGGDEVALMLAVLLVPLCVTDPRLNQWSIKASPPRSWNIMAGIAYFAIQLQAAFVYLQAGAAKLAVPQWREGTAVYYYTTPFAAGPPVWLTRINDAVLLSPLVAVVTWGVLLIELLLFACIFARPFIKRKFLVVGLVLHFLIAINFGLVSFFFSMSALLILYLDDENVTTRLIEKWRLKWHRSSKHQVSEVL